MCLCVGGPVGRCGSATKEGRGGDGSGSNTPSVREFQSFEMEFKLDLNPFLIVSAPHQSKKAQNKQESAKPSEEISNPPEPG